MTQDVQPLTWSRRTNLEEHQQFFSKINEIIDNLAPTVDEAEAAIAQATAAIASANDAIATANAASAAASAAATQAQTAASTVAGYDTRLTAAEGNIAANAAGIIALQGRMTAAETKNGQQDTAISALQTADGQNVKINAINDYAVGLTGNQDSIAGNKTFVGRLVSNFNRINRALEKISPAGEYIFAQIPSSADNAHRVVIDYVSRATGISKIIIDTNLSSATLTATAVYNSAQNVPVFNLYTDSNGTQYLGLTCANNDIIEISGGTFHMRGSSTAQQLTFMPNFTSATGYNKITNN